MDHIQNHNPMLNQVQSVPEMIEKLHPELDEQIRTVLTTPEIYGIKKIVLTGNGDCFAAATAAARAFERMLGLPVQVVTPVDLARYYQMRWVGETPGDPLVIALSNSGRAARLIEAVQRVRRHNSMVLAVTADLQSPLAVNADRILTVNIPAFLPSPGVRSYGAMLCALLLLAIRFGEVRLKVRGEEIYNHRQGILRLMEHLSANYLEYCETALAAASHCHDCCGAEFYGSGYELGSAIYGAQKAYETRGIMAAYSDTENWFHVNYFLKHYQRVMTVIFADVHNEAHSRTKEMVKRLQEMERDFVLITNDNGLSGRWTFRYPQNIAGLLSPMLEFAPAAMLTAFLAALANEPYCRGFAGIWEEKPEAYSTTNSEVVSLD